MQENLIIEARKVRKIYRSGQLRVEALRSLDMTIARGEMVAIWDQVAAAKRPCSTVWQV